MQHSKGEGTYPISEITIPEKKDRSLSIEVIPHIEELASSISEHGLIQPIVLTFDDSNKATLVAGWCRLQAFTKLGLEDIPYVSQSNLSEGELAKLRLAENLWRLDPSWQEKVLEIANTHRILMAEAALSGESWGLRETGKVLRQGKTSVQNAVALSAEIEAGNEIVLTAPNPNEAQRRLMQAKADLGYKKLLRFSGAVPSAQPKPKPTGTGEGPLRTPQAGGIQIAAIEQQAALAEDNVAAEFTVKLSELVVNANFREWMPKLANQSLDMIYCDPPYGIEMDNLDWSAADLERVSEEHDVDYNLEILPEFIHLASQKLKQDSYCLFWYDICHEEKIRGWCDKAGLKYCGWPLIWAKTHACRNRAANKHPTKNIEYCFFAYKGNALLKEKLPTSFFPADASAERKMQSNPFAKPFQLSQTLINACTIPGATVCDPFAGEGSIIRSIIMCNRKPLGCELREHHYNRLLEHMRKCYKGLTNNKVNFE